MEQLTERLRELAMGVLLLAVFSLVSCDKDEIPPGPNPPPAKAKVTINAENGDETSLDSLTIEDEGETVATDVESFLAEGTADSKRDFTVSRSGYEDKTQPIVFDEDKTVTFTLISKEAETADLTTSLLLDGSEYTEATVYADESGEELASGSEFTLTREVGTELDIRIEGPDIETQTETLVFDKTKPVDISLTRASSEPTTVKLTITPEIADFTAVRRGRDTAVDEVTTYEITVGDKTFTDTRADGGLLQEGSPLTVEVPANEEVAVSGRFVYIQSERPFIVGIRERSLALGEMNVSPNGDTDVTLEMTHQPACSDGGLDNDYDDVADRNEPGCTANYDSHDPSSSEFVYEANDDAELLVRRKLAQSGARSDTYFISNKAGNRETGAGGANFHPSLAYAAGQIDMFIINKPETDAGFAVRVFCVAEGQEPFDSEPVGISEIVPGDASAEEFRDSPVNGIDRSFASQGTRCGFKVVHESKVRGKDPGNGGGIVRLASETVYPGSSFVWHYEHEELPEDLQNDLEGANNNGTGEVTMEAR